MKAYRLTARRLITDVGVVEYPVVTVGEDGRIAEIESDVSVRSEEVLSAALLDVHTHGAAGHDVMEATPEAMGAVGRFFARHGVGAYLPTTVTAPVEVILRSLEGLAGFGERGFVEGEATPLGVHLEGPFLSHGKRGVHPAGELQRPDVGLFRRMWEASRGTIRLMTVAPELAGAEEMIAFAVGLGVRVSMGHTEATAAEARAGIRAGATGATHTFNAMRALDHREPGVLGVVLDDGAVWAELICDGVHVAPEGVRMWARMKGEERGVLVTDSMSATGVGDGRYMLGGFAVDVKDGVCRVASGALAGSVLTMDVAVGNVQRVAGVGMETAVRMGSSVPAGMLGLEERAQVRVGAWADFCRWDAGGRLVGVVLRGVAVSG